MSDATTKPEGARWALEFPVPIHEERRVTRRGFVACLGAAAACGTLATLLAAEASSAAEGDGAFELDAAAAPQPGGSVSFKHPQTGRPILLIRGSSGEFAAYDQRCTHLLCPVHFNKESGKILCPCHHGVFSAEDGRPLAGPPRKPLPRFSVEPVGGKLRLRPVPGGES